MLREILIHGTGGQGALTAGHLLASASMRNDFAVSVVPHYTPEVRGGEANAILVISSETIGSVLPAGWDVALLLANKAAAKHALDVRPGGLVIYNSSLIPAPAVQPGATAIGIAASAMAEEVGNPKGANMVLLGALCAHWDAVTVDALKEAVHAEFGGRRAKFVAANLAVIDAGVRALHEAGGPSSVGSTA